MVENALFYKKTLKKFAYPKKKHYLCTRFWEIGRLAQLV